MYCFIVDLCDFVMVEWFDNFEDLYWLFCCWMIMNCMDVCLKGLNLIKVILEIWMMLVRWMV